MNKVSIITVCYNAGSSIERTIQSVISQSFDDFEYLVIDGKSTDNTTDIIQKYSDRIDVIISEPDNGIYDAMNKGILKANGEWVIMMNAGDYFSDNNVLKSIFTNNIPTNKTFLYSDIYSLQVNGERVKRTLSWEKGVLIHQSVIYRRSLHDRYGLYLVTKPIIVSDYIFFISIPKEHIMKLNNVIIAVYEGGGISAQGDWALQQSICADVAFGRRSFSGMIIYYLSKRIKRLIPYKIKHYIRRVLG